MGQQIDRIITPASDPLGYVSNTRTHTLKSTDLGLVGVHPYTVRASLVDYPSMTSVGPDATAFIELYDPCANPATV